MTRTPAPRCTKRGCKYVASLPSGLCRKHLKAECDRLFSLRVRAVGGCQSGRATHSGGHQCAHGFSRRYLNIRWDQRNAWCFCAGCHTYYTGRPDEWSFWLMDRWGPGLFADMRDLALSTSRIDLEDVYEELTA